MFTTHEIFIILVSKLFLCLGEHQSRSSIDPPHKSDGQLYKGKPMPFKDFIFSRPSSYLTQETNKAFLYLAFSSLIISCASLPKSHNQPLLKTHKAVGKRFMISTQGPLSTKAGYSILKKGGNAVDAAVAISFALSVESASINRHWGRWVPPFKNAQKGNSLRFLILEKWPLKSHQSMFLGPNGEEQKGKSINGLLSAGVPCLVAGILEIHEKFGSLPLKTLLAPSIELAQKGVTVYPHLAKAIKARAAPHFKKIPKFKGNLF